MQRGAIRATVTGTARDIPFGVLAAGQFLRFNGTEIVTDVAGDVFGPGASTDLAIARWDGASGQLLQNSVVLISDLGQVTGVTALNGRDIARWVDGPNIGSTTLAHVAIWSDTTGRLIEDSGLHVNDIVRTNVAEVTPGHLAEFGDSTGRVLVDSGVIADHVVTNSGTSTDNAITRWDGTSGKVVQNSLVLISDTGQVTGVTALNTRDIARWVDGPSIGGATDNAVARWDTTTGRLLQNSVVTISDTGAITGVTSLNGEDPADFVRGPTPATSTFGHVAAWADSSGREILDTGLHANNIVRTFESEVVSGHLPMYTDSTGRIIEDSGLVAANIVSSPTTSTDNRIARYDGTTGKQIQQSAITIDDSGNISGAGTINGHTLGSWGDVSGPASATDNRVARFDGTTGKLIQQSAVTIDDSGNISNVGTINGFTLGNWVVGPASATDDRLARYSGTTGKLIDVSQISVDDSGNVTGVQNLTVGGNLNGRDPDELVRGPAGATDNRIVRFDGVTGYLVQNSAVTIDDSGNISGVGTLNSITLANLVTSASAFANDNRLVRTDGTTRAVQQSAITIDDSGNISGAGTLNTRTIANFVDGPASSVNDRLALFSGTTGKLIAVSEYTADTLLAAAQASVVFSAGSVTARTVTTTEVVLTSFGPSVSGNYVYRVTVPYAISDTGSNIIIKLTWASASGIVGVTCHAGGGQLSTHNQEITIPMSAIPPVGVIMLDAHWNATTSGSSSIGFNIRSSGASFSIATGTTLLVKAAS